MVVDVIKSGVLILPIFFIPLKVPSKSNELVETVSMDQSSITLCAAVALLLFALSCPGLLAESQPPWLQITFFLVVGQQISGDEEGREKIKTFGTQPLLFIC